MLGKIQFFWAENFDFLTFLIFVDQLLNFLMTKRWILLLGRWILEKIQFFEQKISIFFDIYEDFRIPWKFGKFLIFADQVLNFWWPNVDFCCSGVEFLKIWKVLNFCWPSVEFLMTKRWFCCSGVEFLKKFNFFEQKISIFFDIYEDFRISWKFGKFLIFADQVLNFWWSNVEFLMIKRWIVLTRRCSLESLSRKFSIFWAENFTSFSQIDLQISVFCTLTCIFEILWSICWHDVEYFVDKILTFVDQMLTKYWFLLTFVALTLTSTKASAFHALQ